MPIETTPAAEIPDHTATSGAEDKAKQAESEDRIPAHLEAWLDKKLNAAGKAREERLLRRLMGVLDERDRKSQPQTTPGDPTEEPLQVDEEKGRENDKRRPVDPAVKGLRAQVEAMQRKAEAAEQRATETEQRRLAEEQRTRMTGLLTEAGCTGPALKAAIAVLTQEGRIGRSQESGELVFLTPKRENGVSYVEEEPITEGLKSWLASDDGKFYLPPAPVAGSGAVAAKNGISATARQMSRAQRKTAAGQALLGAITRQT